MLLVGSYPVDVFGGAAKVLVFSVVPVAFVAAVPTRPRPQAGPGLAAAAATFTLGGGAAFHRGLRRHASGSIGTRA